METSRRWRDLVVLLGTVSALAACGGGKSPDGPSPPADVAPTIAMQPGNVSVSAGQTASLQVTATGTAPLTYQWRREGAAISGATGAAYITPATAIADNGARFSVVVTNSAGSVTSSDATLTVSNIPASTDPAWLSGLLPGQWRQIAGTSMSSVDSSPHPPGNTGPQSKVIAWTSFVVDVRDSKVYSAANGGHNDYSGNEVDVLDLELAQPTWREVLAPTPAGQLTNCQSYYADGRPASRHSYYGATFDPLGAGIMLFGGANWCTGGGFHGAVSSYNIGANTWSSAHPNLPSVISGGVGAYAVNPSTGDVYAARDFSLAVWNRSTNSFTSPSPSGVTAVGNEAMSAFDTTRGRILFLSDVDRNYYTVASNSWTRVALTGPNAADVMVPQAALVYVEQIDRYLVRRANAGGTVYQINPSTFEVTTFATSDGGAIPSTLNGPYNKFLYVPRLRGAVYVPAYNSGVWFLRIH